VGGVGTSQFTTRPARTPVVGPLGQHGSMGSVFLNDPLSERNTRSLYRTVPAAPTRNQ
jgi:hypothetical protein